MQKRYIEKDIDGWLGKRYIEMEEEEKQGIGGGVTMERLDGKKTDSEIMEK